MRLRISSTVAQYMYWMYRFRDGHECEQRLLGLLDVLLSPADSNLIECRQILAPRATVCNYMTFCFFYKLGTVAPPRG
jgi:hypothetical protein